MPQTPMYTGFEACYVNRLIVFSQKPSPLLGCLLKIMYLCRTIQMTKKRIKSKWRYGMDETLNEIQSKTEVNPESWTQLKGSLQFLTPPCNSIVIDYFPSCINPILRLGFCLGSLDCNSARAVLMASSCKRVLSLMSFWS